jgi:hypothetical protein
MYNASSPQAPHTALTVDVHTAMQGDHAQQLAALRAKVADAEARAAKSAHALNISEQLRGARKGTAYVPRGVRTHQQRRL